MKKALLLAVAGVIVAVTIAAATSGYQDGAYPPELIRFHVIANSDSAEDQDLKRSVRDAILEAVSGEFAQVQGIEDARRLVAEKRELIRSVAEKVIKSYGKDYPVEVEHGYFDFPVKSYGSFTLPSGNYEAVRVVIGSGKGANWWCVLFPPLCFVDISKSVATEPQTVEVIKDLNSDGKDVRQSANMETPGPAQVELKFKLLEVLDRSKSFIAGLNDGGDRF